MNSMNDFDNASLADSMTQADPTSTSSVRWKVLLLTCLGLMGQFYAFDNPSALNAQMKQHMQEAADPDYDYYFNMLYTAYSLPNLVLPLMIGIAIDRYGCCLIICTLSACVFFGSAIFSTGLGMKSWFTMTAGRVVFGIGGESMIVGMNCIICKWFKGNELAFAFAVNLSAGRWGSVLNDVFSPWIASHFGVLRAVWFGCLLCAASFVSNVGSVVLDKQETEKAELQRKWERAREPKDDSTDTEQASLRDVARLPRIFWVLTAFSVVLYCAILPFNNIASAFFISTNFGSLPLEEAQQRAGNAMSFMFLVVALGMAPFGAFVDFVGMRAHLLLFSAVLAPLLFSLVFVLSPVISMAVLGVVYTVFSGVWWPTIALVVPKHQLGTAYGVATALQNGGLAATPVLIGRLQVSASHGDFSGVIWLLTRFGLVSVLLAVWIMRENANVKNVLSLPARMLPAEVETLPEKSSLRDGKLLLSRRNASSFSAS